MEYCGDGKYEWCVTIKEAFVKGVDTVREMIHEATAPSTEK